MLVIRAPTMPCRALIVAIVLSVPPGGAVVSTNVNVRSSRHLALARQISMDSSEAVVALQADGTQEKLTSTALLQTLRLNRSSASPLNTAIEAVAFSPGGREVATGSADNATTIWNAESGIALRTFYYHRNKVNFIAYSPDGMMILTASKDHRAAIWDPVTTTIDREFNDTDAVESVAFSRNGMFIITGSDNQIAKIWDTRNGKVVCSLHGHFGKIQAVAMNPEGGTAVTGADDMTARIWKVEECVAAKIGHLDKPEHILIGHTGAVNAVTYSPYGRWIVTGSQDYTSRVWDAKNGTLISILGYKDGRCPNCHMGAVQAVAWSPPPPVPSTWRKEHDKVATGSDDGTVKIWAAHSGELLHTLNHGGGVHSVAFDAEGERLVSGGIDGSAKIWRLSGNYQVKTMVRGNLIDPKEPFPPGMPQR